MRAIAIEDDGLRWTRTTLAPPGPGEVQVRVAAAGVNRADLVQRAGHYPPPPGESAILGLEVSGTIVALGPMVSGWQVGDRVAALLAGGGYAERVNVPAGQLLPLGPDADLLRAAALPEVLCTAWVNLVDEAGLQPGERVLLHAGASGVGTTALQLCAARGCPTFVTVGSDAKVARCRALGAEGGHVRHEGSFREAVRAWAPDGVDVILDPVGGPYLEDDIACLASGGRLVVIGIMGGRRGTLDLGRLLVKRLRVVGSVLRSRSRAEKARIVAAVTADCWSDALAGDLAPPLDAVFPIAEAEAAHARLRSNETVGKLVLVVDPDAAG